MNVYAPGLYYPYYPIWPEGSCALNAVQDCQEIFLPDSPEQAAQCIEGVRLAYDANLPPGMPIDTQEPLGLGVSLYDMRCDSPFVP